MTRRLHLRAGLSLTICFALLPAGCSSGGSTSQETNSPDPLEIRTLSLPAATAGVTYDEVVQAVGGTLPYTFDLVGTVLPTGLSLSSTGTIVGTPTTPGSFDLQVRVTDSGSPVATTTRSLSLLVGNAGTELTIWTRRLDEGQVDTPYHAQLQVTAGGSQLTFDVSSGQLPPGLVLDQSEGTLSGTPTTAGVYSFDVRVADALQDSSKTQGYVMPICSTVEAAESHSTSLLASRAHGVAPLSVFFDASGYAVLGEDRPFHHLYYNWDFDDPTSAQPGATGGVAAHVYEEPGTHQVRLAVIAPDGSTTVVTTTIVVDDPDVVFSGTNTICFSNDGTFTGAPAGATHVTTSSFDSALTYVANGKRLLFRRGHSFYSSNAQNLSTTSTVSIGAFDQGVNPDDRGIYANNPLIVCQSAREPIRLQATDIRIADLQFEEATGVQCDGVTTTTNRTTDTLLLRLSVDGFRDAMMWNHNTIEYHSVDPHKNNTIAYCHTHNSRVYCVYAGGENLAFVGNWFERSLTMHVVRITFARRLVLDSNRLEYSSSNQHALKLHAGQDINRYGQYSELIVLRNNTFRSTSPWPVAIGTQSASYIEYVRDVVLEKNTFYADPGSQLGALITCQETTLRSNLFLGASNTANSWYGIQIQKRGVSPTPFGIEVYSNTYYNPVAGNNEEILVEIDQHTGPVLVQNNLVHAPTSTAYAYRGVATAINNLVNQSFSFVSPANLDFRPAVGSAALGAGSPPFRLDDFSGRVRQNNDVGALER